MIPTPQEESVATELEQTFMRTVPGFATGKRQDWWKEKPPELRLTFWLLRAICNASQKQDTKQQQTGKDLEMAEYLLL